MSCGAENAVEAARLLCDELRKARDGLTDNELAIAKKLMRAEVVMGQESVSERVGAIGHHLAIHGKPYDLTEELEKFEAVSHADIRRVIETQCAAATTVAIQGPKQVVEEIDIQRWLV
jgi:predicted Zn-dependent peptidase